MKSLKTNIYFKVGAIFIISLLLLIPTTMIKQLIWDRQEIQAEASDEVSFKWGSEQTITGPFVSVPFVRYVKETKDGVERIVEVKEMLHLLPENLKINGKINPEKRYRGVYEMVVYDSGLDFSGSFKQPDLKALGIDSNQVKWDQAYVTIGMNDLRGIREQVRIDWNGKKYLFNPGVANSDVVQTGIHTPIKLSDISGVNADFSCHLQLKGSRYLYFTPIGKVTDVALASNWATPSFNGAFLPDQRKVDEEGFESKWKVLNLNRNFSQQWTGSKYKLDEAAFGVDLILPVDHYQKSYRSINYALLLIGFTFMVFFFIEVIAKRYIHPIQYVLVGIALVVFFTLLLSFSEHMSYNVSFILSASSTLLLVTMYSKAIFKSLRMALVVGGILAVLYLFIFIIIQLEDFALLMGSLGIFFIVALVMYLSRRMDWYDLTMEKKLEG